MLHAGTQACVDCIVGTVSGNLSI